MEECNICGDFVSPARAKLVGKLCLSCGEEQAQQLAKARKKQIAPAYNKGAYQVIGKNNIKDIGK